MDGTHEFRHKHMLMDPWELGDNITRAVKIQNSQVVCGQKVPSCTFTSVKDLILILTIHMQCKFLDVKESCHLQEIGALARMSSHLIGVVASIWRRSFSLVRLSALFKHGIHDCIADAQMCENLNRWWWAGSRKSSAFISWH